MNFVAKLPILISVLLISQIGQAAEHPTVERIRTFQRRELLEGNGGGNAEESFSFGGNARRNTDEGHGSGGGNNGTSISIGGNAGVGGGLTGGGTDGGGLHGAIGNAESLGGGSGSGEILGSPKGDSGARGEANGGVNIGVNGQTNSLSGIASIPLQYLNTASGTISGIADHVLGTLSSPLTLSHSLFDLSGLENSSIFGLVSGTLLAGLNAIGHSPGTIQASLSGGLQDIIDGITGTIASPVTLSNEIIGHGIQGVLSSPLTFVSVLPANLGDVGSGVLRAVSSPLTISAQILDARVDLTVNSAGGALLPESLNLALHGSISRGIEALINSPIFLSADLAHGLHFTEHGILGLLSSPIELIKVILAGDLNLHTDSPLTFPEESNNPVFNILGGFLVSPFYVLHALLAQLGITLSGVLKTLSSPLTVSGDIIDYTYNTDISSLNTGALPDKSYIGLPDSFHKGVAAAMNSPMILSSTISDSIHLFFDGIFGLFTSPITVMCGYSPLAFPGSENTGPVGIFDSPMALSELLSANVGYTLAGLLGFLSSPVTLSAELLHASVNWNVDSLNVLPEQLALWGVPNSIGTGIASFLEVPFDGLLNIIGFFSSPLAILDGIGIANVPSSPKSPPIFPLDFPEVLPDENLPPYIPNKPCAPGLSGGRASN